eukprot:745716-Hanusia_phi.AAC.1
MSALEVLQRIQEEASSSRRQTQQRWMRFIGMGNSWSPLGEGDHDHELVRAARHPEQLGVSLRES